MGRIGVAPINNVDQIIGNGKDTFPLIQLGDQFQIDFFPQEAEDTGLGLGVLPYFVHAGEEGDGADDIPDVRTVKAAMSDFFNNTHLIRMKKKFSTWTSVCSQGNWEEADPKYWWPSFTSEQQREDEQGKTTILTINQNFLLSHHTQNRNLNQRTKGVHDFVVI